MTLEMQRHLIEMGIMPPTEIKELEELLHDEPTDPRLKCLAKGYFDDPRDPVTGEVNH